MTKGKILAILVFLLIFSVITYFYINQQRFVTQRHHLLCETLKAGMSKDEVLRILEQAGNITVDESIWSVKSVGVLYIDFTDPKGREMYGGFTLAFRDNKYIAANRRIGSDNSETICDFYLPIPSTSMTQN
jgi:hypothetical protein